MARKIIIKNEEDFTASINDTSLPYKSIEHLILGITAQQNGSTAATIPELLRVISEIQVRASPVGEYFEGLPFDGVDLLALNTMLFGHIPEFVQPEADGTTIMCAPLYIPLNLLTNVIPTYRITRSANSKIKNEKLTLGVMLNAQGVPYKYFKTNDTADATGTVVDISKVGRKLKALLIYAGRIPVTEDTERSVKELKIYVNKTEEYHYNWFELNKGVMKFERDDFPYLGQYLQNFRCLIFKDPLPAEDLTVWTKSTTLGKNTDIYFIGVYV